MSSQTFLPWLGEHAFSIILVFLLVVIAYILYTVAFNRRLFPFLLERRVTDVLYKPNDATATPQDNPNPLEKKQS
jgi:hypothetical protein